MLPLSVGRFHLIRVVLALLFVLLFIAIFTNYNNNSDVIKISSNSIESLSLTWNEVDKLSKANDSCPICFGRDACQELQSDITKGKFGTFANTARQVAQVLCIYSR